MKSIFEKSTQDEILSRLEKLTAATNALWGKMNAAQMLAHSAASYKTPTGELIIQKTWVRFIGPFFKSWAYNEKPFSKDSPTAAELTIMDHRDFEKEKLDFKKSFQKLSAGEHMVTQYYHAFFGKLTPEQWGKLMYKHTDHHFRQFGV